MAANIPVVCINDESFINTVIDDLNGKIFENKKEYVKIVIDLMNDKEKLNKLSKQARISAEVHSSKYFAQQVLKVYEIAIGPKEKKKGLITKIKSALKGGSHEK